MNDLENDEFNYLMNEEISEKGTDSKKNENNEEEKGDEKLYNYEDIDYINKNNKKETNFDDLSSNEDNDNINNNENNDKISN